VLVDVASCFQIRVTKDRPSNFFLARRKLRHQVIPFAGKQISRASVNLVGQSPQVPIDPGSAGSASDVRVYIVLHFGLEVCRHTGGQEAIGCGVDACVVRGAGRGSDPEPADDTASRNHTGASLWW